MYGSESQRSLCSSISRRFHDVGHRSYSMTSYGSRRVLYHSSNGSTQTLSAAALQRPRSPFPYPTRLKRPGVRPASPALTENGSVDYSRMVGIDRVSYVGAARHHRFPCFKGTLTSYRGRFMGHISLSTLLSRYDPLHCLSDLTVPCLSDRSPITARIPADMPETIKFELHLVDLRVQTIVKESAADRPHTATGPPASLLSSMATDTRRWGFGPPKVHSPPAHSTTTTPKSLNMFRNN